MESTLLILAALFGWIIFFFEARSARLIAVVTSFSFLPFFAVRIAISSLDVRDLLTFCFLNDPRRARLAVFVTGIRMVISE